MTPHLSLRIGEALTLLRQPGMVCRIRLGVPDDHVMRLLPVILKTFSQAWPLVDVHCIPSSALSQQPQGSLDLIIMTREIGDEVGTLLRRETTLWVSAESHSTHLQTLVPLAMFQVPCFYRLHACNVLNRAGRTYRVAYISASLATLQAIDGAGLAVSAWTRCLVTADMQILGRKEGFPALPEASIVFPRTSSTQSPITIHQSPITNHQSPITNYR